MCVYVYIYIYYISICSPKLPRTATHLRWGWNTWFIHQHPADLVEGTGFKHHDFIRGFSFFYRSIYEPILPKFLWSKPLFLMVKPISVDGKTTYFDGKRVIFDN
jgi:hypothetical protein